MAWKVIGYVFLATILEATGDAVIRVALHRQTTVGRISFFVLGTVLLAFYGTSLNLAPVDFATVTGLYVAAVFTRSKSPATYFFGRFRQFPS